MCTEGEALTVTPHEQRSWEEEDEEDSPGLYADEELEKLSCTLEEAQELLDSSGLSGRAFIGVEEDEQCSWRFIPSALMKAEWPDG